MQLNRTGVMGAPRRFSVPIHAHGLAVSLLSLAMAALSAAPAHAATITWDEPQELAARASYPFVTDLVFDGARRTYVGWWDFNPPGAELPFAVSEPSGRFPTPTALLSSGSRADYSDFGVSAVGEVVVVFRAMGSGGLRGPHPVRAVIRAPDGTVGAPVTISRSGRSAHVPSVAVNARGDAIAAWRRHSGRGRWVVEVAVRPAGGSFGRARVLTSSLRNASGPQVTIGPGGDGLLVYAMGEYPARRMHVYTAAVAADGETGPSRRVGAAADGMYTPDLDQGRDGTVVLAWVGHGRRRHPVTAAIREPGRRAFGRPQALASTYVSPSDVQAVADGRGGAVVQWSSDHQPLRESTAPLEAASRPPRGRFGPARAVSDPHGRVPRYDLAADADGNVVSIWEEGFRIKAALRSPGRRFSAPVAVSPPSHRAISPSVALDGSGGVVATWARLATKDCCARPERIEAARGRIVADTGPARAAQAEPPVLGVLNSPYGDTGASLGRWDPLTLAPASRQVHLAEYHDAWAVSPDGKRAAFGLLEAGYPTLIGVRIVDLERIKVLRDVELGAIPSTLAWVSPRVLLARPGGAGRPVCRERGRGRRVCTAPWNGVAVIDPAVGRVLRRHRLVGRPSVSARTPSGFVVLLRAPPRLAHVDASGRSRVVGLRGARGGARKAVIELFSRSGLAVDPTGERAFVVAANAPVAEVDLRTMRVTYHRVAGLIRAGRPQLGMRQALWLGDGRIAVSGHDLITDRRGTRMPVPAGVAVLDTASWTARTIDSRASTVTPAGDRLLVYHQRAIRQAPVGRRGVRLYGLDGEEVLRFLNRHRIGDVRVVAGRAHVFAVGPDKRERVSVVDLASGKTVGEIDPPRELQLVAPISAPAAPAARRRGGGEPARARPVGRPRASAEVRGLRSERGRLPALRR